jgi:hypothetical protein
MIKTIFMLTLFSPILIPVTIISIFQYLLSPYRVVATSWGYTYISKQKYSRIRR